MGLMSKKEGKHMDYESIARRDVRGELRCVVERLTLEASKCEGVDLRAERRLLALAAEWARVLDAAQATDTESKDLDEAWFVVDRHGQRSFMLCEQTALDYADRWNKAEHRADDRPYKAVRYVPAMESKSKAPTNSSIWVLNANTESGDHYDGLHSWDHEPTGDEVNRALLAALGDTPDIEEGDDGGPYEFAVDGVAYCSYAEPDVSSVPLPATRHTKSKSKDLAAEVEAHSFRWVRLDSFAYRGGAWALVQHQDDGETLLAFDGRPVSGEHVVEWGPWVRPPSDTEYQSVVQTGRLVGWIFEHEDGRQDMYGPDGQESAEADVEAFGGECYPIFRGEHTEHQSKAQDAAEYDAEIQGNEVECPGCGRVLPETTGQRWEVTDGDPLGCGCAGCWSTDGGPAEPVHDDECLQCARDEIEDLRARLAKAMECKSITRHLTRLAGELGSALTEMERGTAYAYVSDVREALRDLAAMESGSHAISPMRRHLDTVGAVIDALGPGEECTSDVRRDLGLPLANNDGEPLQDMECRSVEVGLADELAAIHDTIGRGLARRFSAAADEAQRALGAIVDRLRARDTDCGSADDGGES